MRNSKVNLYAIGASIKCWSCRSDSDPKCADPFDNTTVPIIDCNQKEAPGHLEGVKSTMCRKIRQKGNSYNIYLLYLYKIDFDALSEFKIS